MNTWIMIIVITTGGPGTLSGGLNSKTQLIEFNSHESCVNARDTILEIYKGQNVSAICMEK